MGSLGRENQYLLIHNGNTLMVDDVDCCCAPDCIPPTQWAIVDYTNGIEILLSGLCTANARPNVIPAGPGGGFMEGFPTSWRTRGYSAPAVTFETLKIGVFFYCPAFNAWFKSNEYWDVTKKKCCGGDWWNEHQLPAQITDPCCNEAWIGRNPPQFAENFANTFLGTVDEEWTNMRNWAGGATPWELKLPDKTIDVTVLANVYSNAKCPAEAKKLDINGIGGGGSGGGQYQDFGIRIEAADSVTMNKVAVLSATKNPQCPIVGEVISAKDIEGTKVDNYGNIIGTNSVILKDLSWNQPEGYVESKEDIVAFQGATDQTGSTNQGEVKAGRAEPPSCKTTNDGAPIMFQGKCRNIDCARMRNYTRFEDESYNQTTGTCSDFSSKTVEFCDSSMNYGVIDTAYIVRFCNNASNRFTGSIVGNVIAEVQFYGNSYNLGGIDTGPSASKVTFWDSSFNMHYDVGGFIMSGTIVSNIIEFHNSSHNEAYLAGKGSGTVTFSDSAKNGGDKAGSTPPYHTNEVFNNTKAIFRNTSQNYTSAVVQVEAEFWDTSKNLGACQGTTTFNNQSTNEGLRSDSSGVYGSATFKDTSSNKGDTSGADFYSTSKNDTAGTVLATGTFYDSSQNLGTVHAGIFNDSSSNAGTVQTNATFNNTSTNTGTVQVDASFNDASSNSGTVNGTTTCNTTGTCP